MNQYFNKIFKLLLLIVPKKRRPNFHNSDRTTDFEAAKNVINRQRVSSEPNPNIEEIKTIEKNSNPDVVTEQPPTEVEKIENEEIHNGSTQQNKNVNDVITDAVVNEPEDKYDSKEGEVATKVVDEDDIKEANETNFREKSNTDTIGIRETTSSKKDSSTKKSVHKTKPQIISNERDAENRQLSTPVKRRRKTCENVIKKDIEEFLQRINKIFIEHKLLGNYDFTEEEYSDLLEHVGLLGNSLLNYGNVFEDKHHKLIFATLVEIAKRWRDSDDEDDAEEKSRFWDYISKHLINKDSINQKLYHAFTDVISQLGKQHSLPIVSTGKKYYSTLMMHSFAPKNSIFSFYDLCYNIFKKDLDFGFTTDDEWLCEIVAAQMKTVLGGGYREDKKVSIGSSAYSIKIGLRSFSQNEDLSADFVRFINDSFYQINKLFNREPINENICISALV